METEEDFKIYALFNAKTRQLTSFTFDIEVFPETIRKNLLVREYTFRELGITDENINLNRFKWIGDYDTGRLADIVTEKKYVVTEKELEEKYDSLFSAKFSMKEVFYELILNVDMKTEKGMHMQRFLKKLLDKKAADTEFYKTSDLHIWETREEEESRVRDAFKV